MKRRRRLAGWTTAVSVAAALAGCGGTAQHHSTTSSSVRAQQASVAPGARGLPTAATQLFASDGSAPTGHDDTVTPGGSIVASSGFNPARDGFAFQNYGFIAGQQLTATVLQQMFGTSVCAHGTGGSCQLYPAAQQWAAAVSQTMIGGHCYGFSMLALRFFSHDLSPSSYGAATTYGLRSRPRSRARSPPTSPSSTPPSRPPRPRRAQPSQIIQSLVAALKSHRGPYYTLGIYNAPVGTQGRDGHAITPLGISNLGNGRYQILVYDNNYPGVTRGLDVNVNTQTWSYVAQTNPQSGQPVIWSGKGRSNELTLIPVSAVERRQDFTAATRADRGSRHDRARRRPRPSRPAADHDRRRPPARVRKRPAGEPDQGGSGDLPVRQPGGARPSRAGVSRARQSEADGHRRRRRPDRRRPRRCSSPGRGSARPSRTSSHQLVTGLDSRRAERRERGGHAHRHEARPRPDRPAGPQQRSGRLDGDGRAAVAVEWQHIDRRPGARCPYGEPRRLADHRAGGREAVVGDAARHQHRQTARTWRSARRRRDTTTSICSGWAHRSGSRCPGSKGTPGRRHRCGASRSDRRWIRQPRSAACRT